MNERKRIGILGLGERSTNYYLHELDRLSGKANFNVVTHSMDFARLNANLPDGFSQLKPLLLEGLGALGRCDVAIIPNVTLHETLDRLEPSRRPVRVSHALKETLKRLENAKTKRVALLGSSYTMISPYWAKALADKNIAQVSLPQDIIGQVDEFRRKVYSGDETAGDIEDFRNTVADMSRSGSIVVACTELSIFTPRSLDEVFDCANIQIEEAIDRVKG